MARKIQPSQVQGKQAAEYQAKMNELRQSLGRLMEAFNFMRTEEGQKIDFVSAIKGCQKISAESREVICNLDDKGVSLRRKDSDSKMHMRSLTSDPKLAGPAWDIINSFGEYNAMFKPMYNILQTARVYEAIAEMDPKNDREISEAELEYVWKDAAPNAYESLFSRVDLSANTKTSEKKEGTQTGSNWTSFASWKSWIQQKLNPQQESTKDTNESSSSTNDGASTEQTLTSLDIDTQYQALADLYITEGKFYCYAAATKQPTNALPKFLSLCDTAFPMATAIDESIQTGLNAALLRHNKIEHSDNNLLLTDSHTDTAGALPAAGDEL